MKCMNLGMFCVVFKKLLDVRSYKSTLNFYSDDAKEPGLIKPRGLVAMEVGGIHNFGKATRLP
jgi:hypothetical protein